MPELSLTQRLAQPAMLDALVAAIIAGRTVKAGCEALGLLDTSVWRCAQHNAELQNAIWAARQVTAEMLYDECNDIADASTKDSYCQDKLRIDTRMRVAGHMIPKVYGQAPAGTSVNLGVQVGLVCDETQRARLIDLRNRIAATHAKPGAVADAAPVVAALPVQVRINGEWTPADG